MYFFLNINLLIVSAFSLDKNKDIIQRIKDRTIE